MHPKEQHLPFKQTGTTTMFSFGYQSCTWPRSNPFCWQTHVLFVTVELIWLLFLNILSFNFVPTPSKCLRLKRFRKSYVNRPDVVLTNHTSYTAFLLDVRCAVQCGHVPFSCSCWSPLLGHLCNLFLLSTPVAQMLTPRWISRRKDWKSYP